MSTHKTLFPLAALLACVPAFAQVDLSGTWADRITESAIATQAVEIGAATREELGEMADAWRRWAADSDGWFAVLHGEIIGSA